MKIILVFALKKNSTSIFSQPARPTIQHVLPFLQAAHSCASNPTCWQVWVLDCLQVYSAQEFLLQ